MRKIKGGSSLWVHDTLRRPFAWQDGYAAFSVGQSGLDDLRAYIRRQKEHHKTVGFKEELVVFLKKHGIEYDERYLWT